MIKNIARSYFGWLFTPRDRILSASSADGFEWKRERGFRVTLGGIHRTQMSYYTFAHQPEGVNGPWEIYFHSSFFDNRWQPQIIKALSDDGLVLRESSKPALVSDHSQYNESQTRAPYLLRAAEGWRMYFTARGRDGVLRILSASSRDRDHWSIEKGFRIDPNMFSSTNPEVTGVSDTAIASLSDGRMRMYFSSEKGSEWFQDIRSAISTDGLNWEIEQGIRISADQPGYRSVANNPTVIKVPGGWRIYFRGSDIAPLWSQIYSAFSPDGLDFNVEGIRLSYRRFGFERHGVAFPHVTKIPGGGFRMYYTGYWGLLFDHKVVAYYIERGKELGLSGSH